LPSTPLEGVGGVLLEEVWGPAASMITDEAIRNSAKTVQITDE
jgi:hypothetical protein